MNVFFDRDHSLYYGADEEQESYITRGLSGAELANLENPALERKEKVEDEKGKKHSSVCSYIDMINDVSQKLKIGFEQYIKAKEEEIRKLKNELSVVKSISDGVHKEKKMLVLNLNKAKTENKQLAQDLDKAQAGNRQLEHRLREVQSEKQQLVHDLEATQAENRQLAYKLYQAQESNKQLAQNREDILKANQQLAHDLGEAQTKSKELARGQGEAMAECSMLEYKLEEAQAENQKLSKKLDDARDEISSQDITIRRMKKDAERKAAAMQVDVSEVKEKIAREMIDSGIRFVKDMKTAIDDSQTFKCMGLLNHMTDDCFGKHEAIHRELKDMIQGIFGSREQVAKEQNEPRPNNVTVEKGGVYNGVVHHQNIHPKVDLSDSLLEVDLKDFLPRYKRKRLGLEGDDYEWR